MNIGNYKTDETLEAGVWCELDDARFLIASINRPAFAKAQDKARRGIPLVKIQKDRRVSDKILADALADACLLDWQNVNDEHGKPLECTPENKRAIMAIPALRDWISSQATDITNFQREAEAADAEAIKSSAPMEP